MAMKRKFDNDAVDDERTTKQLRLVPFPTYEPDTDISMSDASSDHEPTSLDNHHARFNSTSSAVSSGASDTDSPVYPSSLSAIYPAYPSFSITPGNFFGPNGNVDTDSHNFSRYSPPLPNQRPVGLFEPRKSFSHNGACTQIPKLRVACSSGVQGQRTMWSHCEQCGAIEMIDPDY